MSDGPSVRDSLTATLADFAEPTPEPAAAVAPAPAEVVAPTEGAPAAEAEPKAAPEGRDEKGRFAPKEQKVEASAEAPPAQPKIETAPPADPEPQASPETTRIPPSLSAAVKAQWSDLPPEVKKDFARLEETVQTAKAEWGKKGERLNRYDEIMAPRAEKFALQGIDEFTAIKTLLAAQDFLERDPLGGIQHLARSYGVNLQSAGQQPNGQARPAEAQPGPTADFQAAVQAALKPFAEQVQTLQSKIQSSEQSSEAAEIARITAEITAFRSDPANIYFDNVEPDMVRLIESKAARNISEAYQKAIWASDEIRPLLLRAQSADAAKKATDEAARQKAAQSRQAAGSVTGAPAPGATAPTGPPGSVRDSILAARQELGAA